MSFPNMNSLIEAAEIHGFRKPLKDETEIQYRRALADHVAPKDYIESEEIRNGCGWDKFTEGDNRAIACKNNRKEKNLVRLYELETEYCPKSLRYHPDFKSQAPLPVGICGSGIYRFKGTNVYSWYINKRPSMWEPYGEPIILKPREIKKFLETHPE